MNTELRKRLEEAAREYADENYYVDYSAGTTPYSVGLDEGAHDGAEDGFLAGAELGYKDAIVQAKEWMRNYFPDELDGKGFEFVKLDTILSDFESDMNKLLEGEK